MNKEHKNGWNERILKAHEEYRKGENKALEDLSKAFILIATIIIPLSSVLFINKDVFLNKEIAKIFLSSSWIVFFLSIITGLLQLIIDYGFWGSGRKVLHKVYKRMIDKKEISKLPSESRTWPIKAQIVLVFMGLLLFIISILLLTYLP